MGDVARAAQNLRESRLNLIEDCLRQVLPWLVLKRQLAHAEQLLTAFDGKDHEFFEIVIGSPHGRELVDFNHGIGADIVEQADVLLKDALIGGIERAAVAGEIMLARVGMDAAECADLLLHASHGLKHGSADWSSYRRRLEHLIQLLIVALTPE